MALNFNVDPYYDDFDASKNYHRILFKPGSAVQARELTQSQTILQNQISNFADSIFSQNTPVTGGKVTTNFKCYYLKLNTQYGGQNITAANFLNKEIEDSTGTVFAKVVATAEATATDSPTLIITYYSGAQFTDGMTVYPVDGTNYYATTIGTAGGTTCSGISSTASISQGVFYVVNGYSTSSTKNPDGTYSKYSIGNFVTVLPQTVVLDKYDNSPSLRVGLSIVETVYDYINDPSLLDPAIGASNYQAPGADRYKISLELITLPLELGNDDNFIELLRVQNGKVVKQVDGTVYSVIDDYFAKRDYETNGDYVVTDFKLTPGSNAYANIANTTLYNGYYDMRIGAGIAYVRGYRIENQSDLLLTSPRARTTSSILNNSIFIDYGSYFLVNSANSVFDVTTMPQIDLHCVQSSSIVTTNNTTYNSTLVGSAFIRNLQYLTNDSGQPDSNTAAYVYRAYVSDINTNVLSGNVASGTATTLVLNDPSGKFSSVANAYYNATISVATGGLIDRRKVVSYNATTKTIVPDQPFTVAPTTASQFSIIFDNTTVESLVRQSGLGILANADINNSGKVNGIYTGDTILENSKTPEMLFQIGYPYVANVSNSNYISTKVFRSKTFTSVGGTSTLTITIPSGVPMTFLGTQGSALSSDAVKQNFNVIDITTGQVLDFSTTGNNVTISAGGKTVTLTSTTYANPTVDVITAVSISNADNVTNVLKTKNLITGNSVTASISGPSGIIGSNTYIDLTNGQVYIKQSAVSKITSLYVSDVKQITKIIDTKDPNVVPTDDMLNNQAYDVTTLFTLDNGQRDNYYDHAKLNLVAGANPPVGNILVVFDYYAHTGGDGYFDVNSYLAPNSSSPELYQDIPTYTSKAGTTYRLSDSVDFRPVRKSAQSGFVFEYTGNPAVDDTGILIPQNLNEYTSDYTYYLGRKDKLVLTKDKIFKFIQGTPGINPILPTEPDGALVLANLSLDPFTAYVPGENPPGVTPNLNIDKVQHKRWAKSEITDLQSRVNNLEYYSSLNLLEQNAQSLQVPDVNGLNRFKNGILVDDFSSFATADTFNPDFSANINTRKKQLGPVALVDNYTLHNPVVMNSLGTITGLTDLAVATLHGTHTAIFTLPYTTANIITQPLASSTVSLNPFAVYSTQGVLQLSPPMDNWVDNEQAPALFIADPAIQIYQQNSGRNITNSSDFATIPGTKTTQVSQVATSKSLTTTTTTYASQLQNITTTQGYSPVSSTVGQNNGYLTSIAILPYIRAQQLIIKAKALLQNANVSCWFDGVNVDGFLHKPNTIELNSVSGTFKENDIVGFYDGTNFTVLARVVSVYNYPGESRVRLYTSTVIGAPLFATTTTLVNAILDANGNYVKSTASGTLNAGVNNIHTTGTVTAVGGNYTPQGGAPANLYKIQDSTNFGTFLNAHGVWNTPIPSGNTRASSFVGPAYTFAASVPGTYTIETSSSCRTFALSIDGTVVVNVSKAPKSSTKTTKTLTAGNHTISYNAVRDTATSSNFNWPALAVTITDPTGKVIFDSAVPTNVQYDGVAQEIVLPGGGAYFTQATKFKLNNNASKDDGYYVGATIKVTSKFVYSFTLESSTYTPPSPAVYKNVTTTNVVKGKQVTTTSKVLVTPAVAGGTKLSTDPLQYKSTLQTYAVKVTAYDGTNQVVTLSEPIDISMGKNSGVGDITSTYTMDGTIVNLASAVQTSNLPVASTDETGNFTAIFNLPNSTFQTGSRVFRIDNRTVPTDATTATTYAEATFTASGLHTTSQKIQFGPSIDASAGSFTSVNQVDNKVINVLNVVSKRDPVAQTFLIEKDSYPNGAFISSVRLFFYSKPSKNVPVTLSIVGTLNGYPDGKKLDYSTVIKNVEDIKTSRTPHYLDPNTYTEFAFDAPVYIQPGVLYAILIESSSPDYLVYFGQQNSIAVPSTAKAKPTDANPTNPTKIGSAPYVGALFESQNGITWTADQTKDLMFVINQCVFDTTYSPQVQLSVPKSLPFRKIGHNDIQHYQDANTVTNLFGNYANSSANVDAFNVTTTDFVPTGTNITYGYTATLLNGNVTTPLKNIFPGRLGCPTPDNIELDDGLGERTLIKNVDATFSLYATLSSTDKNLSPIISDDGTTVYAIKNVINNMGINNTSISLANTGFGYDDAANVAVTISAPDIGSDNAVLGVTIANNGTGNVVSSVYSIYPGSGYITTPTIKVIGANTTPANVIVYGETSPHGGNSLAKYFTKKVVLAPGSDSGDLRVYYSAYKPLGTAVYVYYKILNRNDTQSFDNGNWQLMTQVGNPNVYSTSKSNIIEYECAPGTNNAADNQISYTSTTGQTFSTFSQFAIKVVLATNDSTSAPYLTDLRALALPSGTGI